MNPTKYLLEDNGFIPITSLSLLLYCNAFDQRGKDGTEWLINRFGENNWTNARKNRVFSYHHYHSTSHEVLRVYSCKAKLHMGDEKGEKIDVETGDVIEIPAGVTVMIWS